MQALGWRVEKSGAMQAYVKKVPGLCLWLMKLQRIDVRQIDLEWMIKLKRRYRLLSVYVELMQGHPLLKSELTNRDVVRLERSGFKQVGKGMLPTKTRLVPVGGADKEMLERMKAKTRYNIGLAQRKGLVTQVLSGKEVWAQKDKLDRLISFLSKTRSVHRWMGMCRWITAQVKAFGDQAYVVTVLNANKELLAAAVLVVVGPVAYYSFNGSTREGRGAMAPTLVVWEGMLEARRRGCKWLDLDGIYDERYPIEKFKGFSRFKAGFGGQVVTYPPAFRQLLPGR